MFEPYLMCQEKSNITFPEAPETIALQSNDENLSAFLIRSVASSFNADATIFKSKDVYGVASTIILPPANTTARSCNHF